MTTASVSPWLSNYQELSELAEYGDNALGVFALALRFDVEDLVATAAEAITDGTNDKKCDVVFIDPGQRVAVVAQCYFSQKQKSEAPSNKASDLNAAANWLLLADIDTVPERIQSHAAELRHRLERDEIDRVYFWYVHNLPQSKNVASELQTLEHTVKSAITTRFPNSGAKVQALEVGNERLNDWYHDTQSPILVNGDYTLDIDDGFELAGPSWQAYVTALPIQFLRKEFKAHGVKLFSANIRDYLGSIKSDANINHGIQRTAESEPDNFWPYNNGLTILVNSFSSLELKSGKKRLKFSGMSIVNGAQTTGAIAGLSATPPTKAKVSVRFIKTEEQVILYNIIRYNNSQNKVAAADFRSTDGIQKRLRAEFSAIPNAEYDGGRRGGLTDAIKRRPNLLASGTVGQALAAMHGDATVAYNQKSEIWSNDGIYNKYFNDQLSASHIVFAYALLRAIEERKSELFSKSRTAPETLTDSEEKQLAFFPQTGCNLSFCCCNISLS